MPNWSGTILTNKGLALQAKVEAGMIMQITKLKIGDGVLGTGQSVAILNDLVSPQKNITISSLTPLTSGICKVHGVVTNEGITTGFYVRELGVFAQDPDDGEILYAYTADGAPDFLPAEGGAVAVSEELVVNVGFSNASSITANINLDGLVTVNVLNNAVSAHNASLTAHADLQEKFDPATGHKHTGVAGDAPRIDARTGLNYATILLSEINVESAVTSISFTDLDINSHGDYVLIAKIINPMGSMAGISLYYNSDTNPTNYNTQTFVGHGVSSNVVNMNNANIFNVTANAWAVAEINIYKADSTACAVCDLIRYDADGTATGNIGNRKIGSVSNVTRIDIIASVANSIGAGSKFRLYRRL